jgi:dihydroorotate dehydrogenase electron transfer subunit
MLDINNKNVKRISESRILGNKQVAAGYYRMDIECGPAFQAAIPGQFVMIRPKDQTQPLLRRPFSIHDLIITDGDVCGFQILYKVVGWGTEILSMCHTGDCVDVLGPLGNGFSVSDTDHDIYMAAGGIGVAPFVFLSKWLRQRDVKTSQMTFFLGGRSSQDLLCCDILDSCGLDLILSTDDGSVGRCCVVTIPLKQALEEKKPDILYACGPVPMLKRIIALAQTYDFPCQVSIETMMACGMGACLGCAVEQCDSTAKYLHACIDGPVFDARTIKL